MPSERDKRLKGAAMLRLFPQFLQQELVAEKEFREALGLKVGGNITVSGTTVFDRDLFHAAVAALYEAEGRQALVEDEQGHSWQLSEETHERRSFLRLKREQVQYLIEGAAMLAPHAQERLAQFDVLAARAGRPPHAFAEWLAIVAERPLTSAEIGEFDDALARTPVASERKIRAELATTSGKAETIAPPDRELYQAFAGPAPAADVGDFIANILPGVVDDWLQWDGIEGAKMALLLASHGDIMAASPLAALPVDQLVSLAQWAYTTGDLLSKTGMVELMLAALPGAPELAAPLASLTAQLRDIASDPQQRRTKLLMAAYIIVDGELSRTGVIADFPPFQRRIAALAQASLFERHAAGRLDVDKLLQWAMELRGRRFVLQCLVDMRREPRWAPEGASDERLSSELLGRLHNAAARQGDAISDKALRALFFGKRKTSIAKHLKFPASFLPGPIEGANNPAPEVPEAFDKILDRTLGGEALTAQSVIALINVCTLFKVGNERVDRAIELIRAESYRFSGDIDVEKRNLLLNGLAAVAATTRRPDLAKDVCIMLRRLRIDKDAGFTAPDELSTCLAAAAAHDDLAIWAEFVGTWAVELALNVEGRDEAEALREDLEVLCVIEPALRATAGRGLAALNAYLGI